MKSPPFQYTRAGSLGEACDHLGRLGDEAKLIAGGQSLVPMLAMRLLRPGWLVDINEVSELKFVAIEGEQVRIGACTRQSVVERDEALARELPLLREALKWVGHSQTRNRGTIGGSLVHADPSAELPLLARTLGARIVARSTRGQRMLEAAEFFTGAMSTALRPDECVEEIQWPLWRTARTGSSFTELSIRHGDFAIVAATAQVAVDSTGRCERAAFGLGGVGTAPLAFPGLCAPMIGTKLEDSTLQEAAQAAAADCDPMSDLHASADYRRHLAAVLAGRVLREARDRALNA